MSKLIRERIFITVKTYPTLSNKYASWYAPPVYAKTEPGFGFTQFPFDFLKLKTVIGNISGSKSTWRKTRKTRAPKVIVLAILKTPFSAKLFPAIINGANGT